MDKQALNTICEQLQAVKQRITQAEQQYGRTAGSVKLLAVSKYQPLEHILGAINCQQYDFGESYLNEALSKVTHCPHDEAQWHYIGPIQSNKTKRIAQHFSWVHSVDRLIIAKRLSDQRPPNLPPLNICLQINISNEDSKSGCTLSMLPELAHAITNLPHIKLRGLMAIPERSTDFDRQRENFHQISQAKISLITSGIPLDTLSMGMSMDLEAAIAEGATMVRIGTAIFGPRPITA